jgi:pimeloyl-ACP methyl ester carboxylesterase
VSTPRPVNAPHSTNTRHWWFRSGHYALLGHLDTPQEACERVGVVIVPPFGWEDVCSYRPLRFMAQAFAKKGIPTLRYDLPGTGDSSGDAQDPGLFESWIQSVRDAATELRNATGVGSVAPVGIHLGAILAMMAASRGADFQKLVLWGPAAQGRTILRELRAAANMERGETLPEQDAPPQTIPGFEVGGFLISPETQHALEDLDISTLPWPQFGRILVLSRDDLPPDSKLIGGLRCSVASVEVADGRGYFAMMATPQEAVASEDTSKLIAEFLTRDSAEHATHDVVESPTARATSVGRHIGDECLESVHTIETSSLGMFGILAEPEPAMQRSEYGVLYLNAGGVRHTGPNRMWVESARRWAAQGVVSLRLDLQSIGESEGDQYLDIPSLYRECLMEQIEIAMDSLRLHAGVKRFVAIGLCSGACWAFHAAIRNPDVHAAILLNPSLLYWDPEVDRRRILRGVTSGYSQWAEWSRRIRNGIQRRDIKRAARRVAETLGRTRTKEGGYLQLGFATVAQAWSFLEQNQKRVTLVFREGEPLLAEIEAAGQLPAGTNPLVRCVHVPNGGHTFRPLWAQKIVHDLIDVELAAVTGTAPPALTQQADGRLVSEKTVHAGGG